MHDDAGVIVERFETTVAELRAVWLAASGAWPLFADHRERIVEHWAAVPALAAHGGLA